MIAIGPVSPGGHTAALPLAWLFVQPVFATTLLLLLCYASCLYLDIVDISCLLCTQCLHDAHGTVLNCSHCKSLNQKLIMLSDEPLKSDFSTGRGKFQRTTPILPGSLGAAGRRIRPKMQPTAQLFFFFSRSETLAVGLFWVVPGQHLVVEAGVSHTATRSYITSSRSRSLAPGGLPSCAPPQRPGPTMFYRPTNKKHVT